VRTRQPHPEHKGAESSAELIAKQSDGKIMPFVQRRTGAPRPMKMGTIVSPWRYEGAADYALWRVNTHRSFRICYVPSA